MVRTSNRSPAVQMVARDVDFGGAKLEVSRRKPPGSIGLRLRLRLLPRELIAFSPFVPKTNSRIFNTRGQ